MSHILTLVASDKFKPLTEKHVAKLANLSAQKEQIKWLEKEKAVQICINSEASIDFIKPLQETLASDEIDVFIVPENFKPALLLADMESTIIPNEILDDLAETLGIEEQIKEITARGMNGEIDFSDSLRERIALLKGIKTDVLDEKRDALTPNPGAKIFVRTLNRDGALCALVTGGFTYFSEKIANMCGFDHHHANIFGMDNDVLNGTVIDPILGPEAKLAFLEQYVSEMGINASQVLAIGDGSNDLPMLENAGLGIGYHPKPIVKEKIANCVLYGDFTSVLYALGYMRNMFEN